MFANHWCAACCGKFSACLIILLSPLSLAVTPWTYEALDDRMTGRSGTQATITSETDLNFGSPYQGRNYAQITIRQHPKHGQDVIFSIVKGQINCSHYDCRMVVRFDNDRPMTFSGTHPADNSPENVFLHNAAKFISRAKTAKRILIEFTAYRQGTNVVEFIPSQPFAWPK